MSYYDKLSRRLFRTEEDLENIENILSIADLNRMIGAERYETSMRVRRAIGHIITRSARLPSPSARAWVETAGEMAPYKNLVRAIAQYGRNLTVITLNYDCVVEYVCHCMGLPFTYSDEPGVRICKLHGSLNWVACTKAACCRNGDVLVAPMRFRAKTGESCGYVVRDDSHCSECGQLREPLIVPPSWNKQYQHNAVVSAWRAAMQSFSGMKAFVAIGYSMPVADAAVRNLLHVGVSMSEIVHAVVLTGGDSVAAGRWRELFRSSWARHRLCVSDGFLANVKEYVWPSLGVFPNGGLNRFDAMLPLRLHGNDRVDIESRVEKAVIAGRRVVPHLDKDDIYRAISSCRDGLRSASNEDLVAATVARDAQLIWQPGDSVLPVEGAGAAVTFTDS